MPAEDDPEDNVEVDEGAGEPGEEEEGTDEPVHPPCRSATNSHRSPESSLYVGPNTELSSNKFQQNRCYQTVQLFKANFFAVLSHPSYPS